MWRNAWLSNFVYSFQRPITRAFAQEEKVEVPEIPEAGQPVVQHREAEDQPTITMELTARPDSVEKDEDQI